MSSKVNKKAKLKWARKEIGRRLKGQSLSASEKGNIMREVWAEADEKFS